MKKATYQKWMAALFLFVLLELLFQTSLRNAAGNYWSPHVWLLGGLGTAAVAWRLLVFPHQTKTFYSMRAYSWHDHQNRLWAGLVTFGIGTLVIGYLLQGIFEEIAVSPNNSDIVPSIQLYVRRLISGGEVYKPLRFPTWTVEPTYLPMMWLPYLISELANIDYRWTAYLVFLIGVAGFVWRMYLSDMTTKELVLKTSIPFVMLLFFAISAPGVFGYAVELMPAGLYLLLILSLNSRYPVLIACTITACLLSRYAFTFWLPLALLILALERGWWHSIRIGLWVAVGVLGLYIIPFLSKDWGLLQRGLGYYQTTAEGQWYPQSFQEDKSEKPFHLTRGLSYSIYFYDSVEGSPEARLAVNKKVHFYVSLLFGAGVMIGAYLYGRQRGQHTNRFLVVALKWYLVVFYSFLYVPFSYLYMLPMFLTLPLLWAIPFWRRSLLPS